MLTKSELIQFICDELHCDETQFTSMSKMTIQDLKDLLKQIREIKKYCKDKFPAVK